MKLLIILCVEDMQERVSHILHESGVSCMGVMPFKGYRKSSRCSALGWFGRGSACEQEDSLMMFTFADNKFIHKAIDLINRYNVEHPSLFPPRAFALEISEFSNLMNSEE